MKLIVPSEARDVFFSIAVNHDKAGSADVWSQGWDFIVQLDSDAPPQFNNQGIVFVGQRWIASLLSYEWAIAALEGQKAFVLDKDTMFELVARHRRQLSKAK